MGRVSNTTHLGRRGVRVRYEESGASALPSAEPGLTGYPLIQAFLPSLGVLLGEESPSAVGVQLSRYTCSLTFGEP